MKKELENTEVPQGERTIKEEERERKRWGETGRMTKRGGREGIGTSMLIFFIIIFFFSCLKRIFFLFFRYISRASKKTAVEVVWAAQNEISLGKPIQNSVQVFVDCISKIIIIKQG